MENWHFHDVRERYGKVDRFLPYERGVTAPGIPGAVTDDSVLRHYLCLAIARKGGRIGPDDYAAMWLEDLNPERLYFTERIVLEKLRLGMSPWETGRGQLPADAAIMAIAPIGFVNAANPSQAYQDAFCVASVHQDGTERDAAATTAAGFAAAFAPGAGVDEVLATMQEHGTQEVKRLVSRGLGLAGDSENVDAFVEGFYATMLDSSFPVPPGEAWVEGRSPAPTSREVLPAVVGILRLCGEDPNRCIVEEASLGRDADTIASVAGGLSGALQGASAIRGDGIGLCERANEEFFLGAEGDRRADFRRMAERLVGVLNSEMRAAEDRCETLREMTRRAQC